MSGGAVTATTASRAVVGTPQLHESAALHVSGLARYCDDIPLPANTLHAAFGVSAVAPVSYTHLTLPTICSV